MAKQTAEYKNKFYNDNYDNLRVFVPSGRKQDITNYIKAPEHEYGSINAFVNELIREKLGMSVEDWNRKVPKSNSQDDK